MDTYFNISGKNFYVHQKAAGKILSIAQQLKNARWLRWRRL